MKKQTKIKTSPTRILLIGMLVVIFIGTILLKMPISNKKGKNIGIVDAFFTSTSAVCVTGLATKIPAEQFSIFGQIVLMCLIQIGALRIYDIYLTDINVYW